MSEETALLVLVILGMVILGFITWLSIKSLRKSTDAMQQIIGDGSLLNREKNNAR